MARVLIVPGLRGSGPDHWQTWWQSQEPTVRVEQDDWYEAHLPRWSARIAEALERDPAPAWVVAHSFGCLATVQAGIERPGRIAGALLVAPANPDRFGLSAALPATALAFPTRLIASLNDPWLKFADALKLARRWGSPIANLGHVGHINPESGFGPWPQGLNLFRNLQAGHSIPPARGWGGSSDFTSPGLPGPAR